MENKTDLGPPIPYQSFFLKIMHMDISVHGVYLFPATAAYVNMSEAEVLAIQEQKLEESRLRREQVGHCRRFLYAYTSLIFLTV